MGIDLWFDPNQCPVRKDDLALQDLECHSKQTDAHIYDIYIFLGLERIEIFYMAPAKTDRERFNQF